MQIFLMELGSCWYHQDSGLGWKYSHQCRQMLQQKGCRFPLGMGLVRLWRTASTGWRSIPSLSWRSWHIVDPATSGSQQSCSSSQFLTLQWSIEHSQLGLWEVDFNHWINWTLAYLYVAVQEICLARMLNVLAVVVLPQVLVSVTVSAEVAPNSTYTEK